MRLIMTLLAECGMLLSVVTNMDKLRKFIVQGDLAATLQRLGEVHYKAGVAALWDAKSSTDPRREVESAITCFRTAYQAYVPRRTVTDVLPQHTLRDLLTATLYPAALGVRHRNACESALLTAMCYRFLEEQTHVKVYAAAADRSFHWYAHYWSAGMSKAPTYQRGIRIPSWQSGQAELDKERRWLSELRRRLEQEMVEA
jgi:hypothetical protein